MGNDVSFSGSEIALISGMLGAVIGALGWMTKYLISIMLDRIKETDRRNEQLEKLLDELMPVLSRVSERQQEILSALNELVKRQPVER